VRAATCSRRKSSLEGHYAAGHDVPAPYDLAIIPQHILDGPTTATAGPRIPRPITLRYSDDR